MAERDLAENIAYRAPAGVWRRILVNRGECPTRTEDGIEVWPVETFVEALAGDRLWA